MFKNSFNSTFSKLKAQNKKINIEFLVNEIGRLITTFNKKFSGEDAKTTPTKKSTKKIQLKNLDKKLLQRINKIKMRDLNKRIFQSKEELLEVVSFNYSLFKNEWIAFYKRELTLHTL
jgi:hypothetical protein